MTSLKTKALSGMVWSGIERFATQGVQFVLQIVLARLLMPEDYGIIALLAVFLAVGQTFIDSGFSRALIQKNSCTENDYTTTFIFNVVVGVVAFV
ncbi:MAG TPA: oligosaccharide flippase family protein, partial [Bacteroidaceae bacterium]|nr:oligosaccharide flippase family protein [Bacteroidaceae bacterium]